MKSYNVLFEPLGRKGQCPPGISIAEYAHSLGVGLASVCGGRGTCGNCRIQVIEGIVSKPTASELKIYTPAELKAGWRLACQCFPKGTLKIRIPVESMTTSQRIQLEGLATPVKTNPSVSEFAVSLRLPSLENYRADADRLIESLHEQHGILCKNIDFSVIKSLSPSIRSQLWKGKVVLHGDEIIAMMAVRSKLLGLAVDLGTTKIAAYLIDLKNGNTLVSKGIMNPQIQVGEDVVTRINRVVRSTVQSAYMQRLVVDELNILIADMCKMAHAGKGEIVDMVVVGNTAMHHLFLGLPVEQLARSPFVPAVSLPLDIKARELGLDIASGAYVHLLPNIAGYVGGDHVSALLATGTMKNRISLLIDIGTNTEISMINKGRITTLSCASGPAFEGGHIIDGMRAAAGAIERVKIMGGKVKYKTIEDKPPIGICGSGLVDAVAQMYKSGIIDSGGRMQAGCRGVVKSNKGLEFILVKEDRKSGQKSVTISQHDVRELQLAKAGIRAGIQVLLEFNLCKEEQIDRLVIAGAFGTYMDVSSAITLGMLPSLPTDRFVQVGNAAGMGAKLAIISKLKRRESGTIALKAHYIELAGAINFNKTFIQANYLGYYRMKDGKREDFT